MTVRATTAPAMPARADRGTGPQPAASAHLTGEVSRGGRVPAPVIVGVGLLGVALIAVVSLLLGTQSVAPGAILRALSGGEASTEVRGIVDSRIDRTVIGLVVGAAIGVCGVVLQGLTRNPLAEPGILGINAGAALAVVLGIKFFAISTVGGYVWFALAGAVVAAVVVQLLALLAPVRAQPVTMALAGAAIMATSTSVVGAIVVSDQGALDVFRFWQVGSVAGRNWSIVTEVAPFLILGFILCFASGRTLNAIALGDDLARGLGQRVVLHRLLAATGAILLAGSATALAGPIAFVGLVVPHVVRAVVGPDHRRILLGSLFAGPVLVIAADTVGRLVAAPSEVQAGIVCAVVGAPFLVALVRRMHVS
ncbi:iron complex transport system permease protein [Knoellia remsis]|uniref:Iron complex transport system permease protein n=1 Tax=Knoellia remsis TaxID=407159 RepID=A0A2T0UCK3_9MICO|nr:iron ABC transporter permease [Knoellia remsis]PRY55653.1 iron complex transport system permease protein [Knoellia remsis]